MHTGASWPFDTESDCGGFKDRLPRTTDQRSSRQYETVKQFSFVVRQAESASGFGNQTSFDPNCNVSVPNIAVEKNTHKAVLPGKPTCIAYQNRRSFGKLQSDWMLYCSMMTSRGGTLVKYTLDIFSELVQHPGIFDILQILI